MRSILLLITLLLAPAPAHATQAQSATVIQVRLAVTPGQTVTDADIQQAGQIVCDALAWWTAHHPAQPVFAAGTPQVVDMPQPGTDGWLQDMPVRPADVVVWVYLNRTPVYFFPVVGRDAGGLAYGRNALVVFDQQSLPWLTQAVIAHELGHVLYRLPDWYNDDPTCARGIDIMCNASAGYINGIVGCRSMAWLGYPCDVPETPDVPIQSPVRWPPPQSVYLPLIGQWRDPIASSWCSPAWTCAERGQ